MGAKRSELTNPNYVEVISVNPRSEENRVILRSVIGHFVF